MKAYFAGGCFWCTEAIFNRLKGVEKTQPIYIGGKIKNPSYREVCNGNTGHTEGIEIIFDSNVISYETLVLVFFTTHDPTTLNRQGNDVGTQYRSAIFHNTNEEKEIINKIIKKLSDESIYENNIVTEISPKTSFYYAEKEHKSYFESNKQNPYCQVVISPKINKFVKDYFSLLKIN